MTTTSIPTAPLGRTGPVVSRLALGAMRFGAETGPDDAVDQLDNFVGAEGTSVDTADVYADDESERIVGRWLAQRGHPDVVVATRRRDHTVVTTRRWVAHRQVRPGRAPGQAVLSR